MPTPLILASTSQYRQSLLHKLNVPFITHDPSIDESPLPSETPPQLVKRLAEQKAQSATTQYQHGIVIGSDQVAVINGNIIGKPLTFDNAIYQLSQASGQAITFYTGLAVYDIAKQSMDSIVEPFTVHFRRLTESQIRHYVNEEQPFDCAGSFKSEGLGIALFERLEGKDPNTLVGLPLISLIDLLAKHNVHCL
ncbi:Maf family protein [Shewanella surugensis]|uniref:7-methyl-GTP pyrophosphatase n=1 Tax=Shewanella surugensis TaxID=212020 RepID=A0ABT0L903_9GAMM|nr:nucleoside triphosphate pyrophosphatase [Shewanella surugensis]MCL1124186.1 Maf-like protein [Shewanella surugensis]